MPKPTPRPFVLLGLLAACSGSVRPGPAAAGEDEGSPPTAVAAETTEPSPPRPDRSALHVVAVREGAVDLFEHDGAPVLALEGQPVPWVDDRFVPDPEGGHGLPPRFDPEAAFGFTRALGREPGAPSPTWITLEHHYDYLETSHAVYQRKGERWLEVQPRKGQLVAHHSAYVEREGALLGLQQWGGSKEAYVEGDGGPARPQAVQRALERARPAWVRLAGAEITLPRIPAKTTLASAVATADGALHALTTRSGEQTPHRLLMWAPGEAKAETVAVPELGRAHEVALSTSGDWILAHGALPAEAEDQPDEGYLALGHAGTWERVPVPLPERDADVPPNVLDAARTPEGELWIALGVRGLSWAEAKPVWRKPVSGAWEPVPLPAVEVSAFGPSHDWIFEDGVGRNTWVELERTPLDLSTTRAAGLSWIAGAVWVVLQLDSEAELYGPRSLVLRTGPAAGDPTVLPPLWKTGLWRTNAAPRSTTPGRGSCSTFTLVLGPASLASERPELAEAIAGLEVEGVLQPTGTIYTGRLDGKAVLATQGVVSSPAQAEAVRKAATDVVGAKVALDCRVPWLETVVKAF